LREILNPHSNRRQIEEIVMGDAFRICKYCRNRIEVGDRCEHLLYEHRILPPEEWLKEHDLKKDDPVAILRAYAKGTKPNHEMKFIKEHYLED
jgi:hypothetical protein